MDVQIISWHDQAYDVPSEEDLWDIREYSWCYRLNHLWPIGFIQEDRLADWHPTFQITVFIKLMLSILHFGYAHQGWSITSYTLVQLFYMEISINHPSSSFSREWPLVHHPSMYRDYVFIGLGQIYPIVATLIDKGELIKFVVHIPPEAV